MKVKSPLSALAKTAKEFAEHTSVHGVGYVADKKVPIFSNLLWASVCLLSMSLAIYLSVETYNQWQERPVITTLRNTTITMVAGAVEGIVCRTPNVLRTKRGAS